MYDLKTDNDNMEDVRDLILDKTRLLLNEAQEKFKEDVFEALYNDIENWLFERFDNVRREYFDGIVNFLCGSKYNYVKDEEKLKEWLSDIGFTQETLRRTIYIENKDIINKAITHDAIKDVLEGFGKHSFLRDWTFSNITVGYSQSLMAEGFLKVLIEKDGFDDYMHEILDDAILKKMEYVQRLNKEIADLENQLYD